MTPCQCSLPATESIAGIPWCSDCATKHFPQEMEVRGISFESERVVGMFVVTVEGQTN